MACHEMTSVPPFSSARLFFSFEDHRIQKKETPNPLLAHHFHSVVPLAARQLVFFQPLPFMISVGHSALGEKSRQAVAHVRHLFLFSPGKFLVLSFPAKGRRTFFDLEKNGFFFPWLGSLMGNARFLGTATFPWTP